ncbi:MAG: NDP-sugar synthase [Acidimicrobiales bacterium]
MKAIVLVGGFGTRLRPLTLSTPKQMLPVVNRPMIERVVESLAAGGVTDAVLSLGYRPDAFIDCYPSGVCAGVRLHYAVEPEPLDTAGAIRFAARHAALDETFVVLNGDVLTDLDLGALIASHHDRRAEATIALTPVEDPSRYGVVPTDDNGLVRGFIEKPPRDQAPTNWINAGTYVLEPSVIDRIPGGRKVSIERETFPALVADRTLYAVKSDVYWVDAGTPATYLEVNLDLLDGKRGEPESGIDGRTSIAPTAKILRSVIGSGTTIGADAEIVDSVIMSGGRISPRAVVRDSIIGVGVSVGAGASMTALCVIGDGQTVEPGASLEGARLPSSTAS